jgi:Lectin C-type domain
MRDKGFLYCALGLLAACDAYDASLLSSTRLGSPTAVNDENVAAGSHADADEGTARAGTGAAIADGQSAGSSATDRELSPAGSAAIAQQGGASRGASSGGAGAGGRAGAGAGAGGHAAAAGAAANGGGAGAGAGHGAAGSGGGVGGSDAGAGAGAGGGGATGAADGGGCGEPGSKVWTGNDHCYFPLSALGSWNLSRDACSQRSASLVTITSAQEQAFAATLLGATPSWIGLSKFGAAQFSWIDGEALSYTNWEPGAPKVSGEVAAALRNGTQQWFDDAVTASHAALCERP